MLAASEAVGAPGGSGGDAELYEIRNDEGFVYKVARGAHLDSASSSQPAAGPNPKAAGLRRRRRALLLLRDKRLRDLARWEALASELLAPLPAPQPSASPPASSQPVAAANAAAASSSSASVLDDLIAQVDTQEEFLKKVRNLCDEVNALCDAACFASGVPPMWGADPKELMAGLCSPGESTASECEACFASGVLPMWGADPKELMAGLCSPGESTASGNLDEQNGRQEAPGVSSTAAEMIKNSVKKQTRGHGRPPIPPILTGSRIGKSVTNHSGSNNVASQASGEPKRKKVLVSTSTAPGTPGSQTRRKAESTPGSASRRQTPARAPGIVSTLGPLTRGRAAS